MKKEKLKGWGFIFGCIGFFVIISGLASNTLRFHPVYKQGMEMVKNDADVIELFGSPIRSGFSVPGREEIYRFSGGFVNLETTISGPEARGIVFIMGTQTEKDGPWQVDSISIRIDGELVLTYDASEPDKGFQPVRSEPALDSEPPASPTPPPPAEEPTEVVE